MIPSNPSITCVLACGSRDALRRAELFARLEIDLGNTFVDTAIAFPNGVERRMTQIHELGDYFERVYVGPEISRDSESLMIVFQVRQGAKRFWKDMMLGILRSIEESVAGVSIESITRSPD